MWSLAIGIGHDDEAVAAVWRADRGRWYNLPFRSVPDGGKIAKDVGESEREMSSDILKECVAGS
jgi:hypothetical protein